MSFFYIHCRRIEKELKDLGWDFIELSNLKQSEEKPEEQDRYYLEDKNFIQRVNKKAKEYLEKICEAIHTRRNLLNKFLPEKLVYFPISKRKLMEMRLFVDRYQEYLKRGGNLENAMD